MRTRLAHHERQVQQLRALVAAYEPGAEDGDSYEPDLEFMAPIDVRRAEDAVAEARGMAKFLKDSEDPVSIAFVDLLEAVVPVINHGRGQRLPLS